MPSRHPAASLPYPASRRTGTPLSAALRTACWITTRIDQYPPGRPWGSRPYVLAGDASACGRSCVAQPRQRDPLSVGDLACDVGERAAVTDMQVGELSRRDAGPRSGHPGITDVYSMIRRAVGAATPQLASPLRRNSRWSWCRPRLAVLPARQWADAVVSFFRDLQASE